MELDEFGYQHVIKCNVPAVIWKFTWNVCPCEKNKVLVQRDSYGYLWCLIVDFATSAMLVANIWVILLVCDQVICEEPC